MEQGTHVLSAVSARHGGGLQEELRLSAEACDLRQGRSEQAVEGVRVPVGEVADQTDPVDVRVAGVKGLKSLCVPG